METMHTSLPEVFLFVLVGLQGLSIAPVGTSRVPGFADFAVKNESAKIVTAFSVEGAWPGTSLPPAENPVDMWSAMSVWPHSAQPEKFGPGDTRLVNFGIQNEVSPVARLTAVVFSDQTWDGDARIVRGFVETRRGTLAGLVEVVKLLDAANTEKPEDPREALRIAAARLRALAAALPDLETPKENESRLLTLQYYADLFEVAANDRTDEDVPLLMARDRLKFLQADVAALRSQCDLKPPP